MENDDKIAEVKEDPTPAPVIAPVIRPKKRIKKRTKIAKNTDMLEQELNDMIENLLKVRYSNLQLKSIISQRKLLENAFVKFLRIQF